MAVRLLQTHDVSDLCIGKPALQWLPPTSTVADAVTELESAAAAAVAGWDGEEGSDVAGRVCMADVLLFLCAGANLASPAAALHQATLSDLLAAGGAPPPPVVRRIEPDARLRRVYPSPDRHVCEHRGRVLEAVDSLLGGAHCLVVPLQRRRGRGGDGELELCWLTLEDVARFFLGSIGLFSPTASRSVSDLGVVRPASLAVAAGDAALSAVPLLRAAVASHASVAVAVPGLLFPRRLAGEIAPSALCSCDVSVAAAIAALSAGDLLGFIDWGSAPPEARLHAVRSRLRRRNLLGMLDLLYAGVDPSSSSSSSASSSSSSSSDDDEDDSGRSSCMAPPGARRGKRGLFSARAMGRRPAAEAIVCHKRSSLVAVMVQAMAHRATHVWVVEEEERELVGVVGLLDVLRVLRNHLHQPPI